MEAVFARRVPFALSWAERRGDSVGGLVALSGDTMVGLLGMVGLRDGAVEVAQLYVRPAYQGEGVGSALWDEALRAVGERGVRRLHVWTLERARAIPFYLARGCVEVGRATASVGPHVEPVVELARDVPHPGRADSRLNSGSRGE